MVILDTNIIIDHQRQPKGADTWLKRLFQEFGNEQLSISVISVQELYVGRSVKEKDREQELLMIINFPEILPYSFDIARLAGELTRGLNRPISFPDAAIAATAIINGAKLATLNKKDFRGIKDLELL